MRKYILALSLVFLCACSSKNESIIETNLKTQTLMFSQKQKISHNNENAIVTLSYLNPVLDEASKDDVFVLSLTPSSFAFKELKIYVNNQEAKALKLDKNDSVHKFLIQNEYTQFYKIIRPSSSKEYDFKVKICLEPYPCFELNLQKYSKSLYYRSEDVDTQYN